MSQIPWQVGDLILAYIQNLQPGEFEDLGDGQSVSQPGLPMGNPPLLGTVAFGWIEC